MRWYLEKYYMDSVDRLGNACIFYHARARFGICPLTYMSAVSLKEGDIRQRGRLGGAAPQVGRGSAAFSPGIAPKARWAFDAAAGFERELCALPELNIRWQCIAPAARCRGGGIGEGHGLVEKITLKMDGFKFPFSKLEWGRFIAYPHSVVWIRWSGGLEKRWVFLDGRQVEAAIGEDAVVSGRFRLRLEEHAPLRRGRLGQTVLNRAVFKMLPLGEIRRIDESKRVSRGTLWLGGRALRGYSINEIVFL